jgi:hypothetical protein
MNDRAKFGIAVGNGPTDTVTGWKLMQGIFVTRIAG